MRISAIKLEFLILIENEFFIFLTPGVRIGFEQELYVDEEGNTIEVCARIFNGDLERNLVVSISSMDMTARGESLIIRIMMQLCVELY